MKQKSHAVIIIGIVLASIVIITWVGGPDRAGGGPHIASPSDADVTPQPVNTPVARPPLILLEPEIDAPARHRFAAIKKEIHWRESRNGQDPNCLIEGEHGELGEYGFREIMVDEVYRISGYKVARLHNPSCEKGIDIFYTYWVPRLFPQSLACVGPATVAELYEVWRYGVQGFKERREAREMMTAIGQASDEISELW